MSVTSQISNIVLEPVDAQYGAKHRTCFDALSGSTLDGLYFLVSSTSTDFYVWFNTGVSVDPSVANRTGIEVDILIGDTASQVATKVSSAINLMNTTYELNSSVQNSTKIIIESQQIGLPKAASASGTSLFVTTVLKQGFDLQLGFLDGDVEVGLDEQLLDITAHQTGSQLLGQTRTGVVVGPITLTLKEATVQKLKTLVEKGVGTPLTPSVGVSPTEVTTIGSGSGSKQFGNVTEDGGSLILHPVKNALNDYSGDLCFWLAYPKLNAVVFSGENNKTIEVEFSVFLDESKVNKANLAVIGNHTQNYLKFN